MDFNISKIISNRERYYDPDVRLDASITESGTELNVTVTKTMRMDHDPYHLRIDFPSLYRPGFPTFGEVELVNINQRYDEETITICYSMTTDRNMHFEEIEPCANYTFGDNNKVEFTIPPLSSEVRSIYVSVSINCTCQKIPPNHIRSRCTIGALLDFPSKILVTAHLVFFIVYYQQE